MRLCFPDLIAEIDQFRFKHSKNNDEVKETSIQGAASIRKPRCKRKVSGLAVFYHCFNLFYL